MNKTPIRHPVVTAALWMLGALLSFSAMAVSGRELSKELGTFEIVFLRSVVAFVIVATLVSRSGWRQITARRLGLHALRNVAHFAGQFGWFYAIALIPLAEVFAIEFTVPAWTMLLAVMLLGERITGARLLAIGLGFVGMLIILRPGLAVVSAGALAVVGASFCFALSNTLTKKLAMHESALAIVFYMTAIQTPLGMLPALHQWITPPLAMWPWLLVVGATALAAHFCMARALKLADATVVVPMDFLRLPLIALAGFVFYGEKLDWLVLAGAVIMVAGNFANILAERSRTAAR